MSKKYEINADGAGCRSFTMAQAREHADHPKHKETYSILDALESLSNMTRDDIICMAQECQRPHLDGIYEEALQEFGAMVAAAARNMLALIQAIRARGEG